MRVFNIRLFIIILSAFCLFKKANASELSIKFVVNGKTISGVKYYLIVKGKGYLAPIDGNEIDIPDSLKTPYSILLVYKEHIALIPIIYSDTRSVDIYFDNRAVGNLANKFSGGEWFSPKYIHVKKKYLIDYRNGFVSISVPSKTDYLKKYAIVK